MGLIEARLLTKQARLATTAARAFIGEAYAFGPPFLISASSALRTAQGALSAAAIAAPELAPDLQPLASDAGARAEEAVGVSFVPWPFIYIGIAALDAAVLALHNAIPEIVVLEPVAHAWRQQGEGPALAAAHKEVLAKLGVPAQLFAQPR